MFNGKQFMGLTCSGNLHSSLLAYFSLTVPLKEQILFPVLPSIWNLHSRVQRHDRIFALITLTCLRCNRWPCGFCGVDDDAEYASAMTIDPQSFWFSLWYQLWSIDWPGWADVIAAHSSYLEALAVPGPLQYCSDPDTKHCTARDLGQLLNV